VFTLVELLFPVGATATVGGAILDMAEQSTCRLLCQVNIVATATKMTHRATPTATVASRWAVRASVVDITSVIFGSSASAMFVVATSVLKHNNAVRK